MLVAPPAAAPEATCDMANFPNSVFLSYLGNNFLMLSLKAKLKAAVGTYRMQLAKFPRQRDEGPSSEM